LGKAGLEHPVNGLAALLLQSVDRLLAVKETRNPELMLEVIQAATSKNSNLKSRNCKALNSRIKWAL
jgi:hypothetical protein